MSIIHLRLRCRRNPVANDKRTATFAQFDCPPDAVVLELTESDSTRTTICKRGNLTFTSTNSNEKIKPDTSTKTIIRTPPQTGQVVFNVQFDDSPRDLAFFFRKATYCFKSLKTVTSNTLLIMPRLLDLSVSYNFTNNDFLLQERKDAIKSIKSSQLQTANCKVVNIVGIVKSLIRTGDRLGCAWVVIFENLAVDVMLGTSFIDQRIRKIFATEQNVVPRHLNPVAITSGKKSASFMKH